MSWTPMFRKSEGNRILVILRAGKTTVKEEMIHPDLRKGLIYVYQSDDSLIHFCWKDRTTGVTEDDMIILPNQCEFERMPECKTGIVYYRLKFTATNRKFIFWLQSEDTARNEVNCEKIRKILNNPPNLYVPPTDEIVIPQLVFNRLRETSDRRMIQLMEAYSKFMEVVQTSIRQIVARFNEVRVAKILEDEAREVEALRKMEKQKKAQEIMTQKKEAREVRPIEVSDLGNETPKIQEQEQKFTITVASSSTKDESVAKNDTSSKKNDSKQNAASTENLEASSVPTLETEAPENEAPKIEEQEQISTNTVASSNAEDKSITRDDTSPKKNDSKKDAASTENLEATVITLETKDEEQASVTTVASSNYKNESVVDDDVSPVKRKRLYSKDDEMKSD